VRRVLGEEPLDETAVPLEKKVLAPDASIVFRNGKAKSPFNPIAPKATLLCGHNRTLDRTLLRPPGIKLLFPPSEVAGHG